MINRVRSTIIEQELIKKGELILVGLSGGMDSMALIDILMKLSKDMGFTVQAAHLDHGIRDDSAQDLKFVARWCEEMKIPLVMGSFDVPAVSQRDKVSIEVAARSARHTFLRSCKVKIGAHKIALAHHMNDQAETLLHRLFRGSSIDGLAAMALKNGDIIRPLLGVLREDIERYCKVNKLPWREDETNQDTSYTRNALRHKTLPHIKDRYNPSIIETLCRTANLAGIDRDYFALEVERLIKGAQVTEHGYFMSDEGFLYLHRALRRRCIRAVLGDLGLNRDVSQIHIHAVDRLFIDQGTGKKIELPGGYAVLRHAMGLELIREDDAPQAIVETVLNMEGDTYVPGAGNFYCELLPVPPRDIEKHSKYVQYFDALTFTSAVVRARKEGDMIYPLGAPGKKKLKDYFIDKKVSRWQRDFVPLLAHGERILWAVGYAVDHDIRVSQDTTAVYKITYKRELMRETNDA